MRLESGDGGKVEAINGLLLGNHKQQVRIVHANTFIGGVSILVLKIEALEQCLGSLLGRFPPKYAKKWVRDKLIWPLWGETFVVNTQSWSARMKWVWGTPHKI